MLSEKDRAVICSMIRTGMSLDTLKACFPQFDAGDVETLYREEKKMDYAVEKVTISRNCS